ncbi:MAG: DUF3805 domain-containing protein [Bacteroidaceae bacterium]
MNIQDRKFISPGAWFSLIYPKEWNEFEDTEDSFLFYNPNKWSGNFRISAFKADSKEPDAMRYGEDAVKDELKNNAEARLVKVGKWDAAYSSETFQEEGEWYTSHVWIMGESNLSLECSFTVPRTEDIKIAEEILNTIEVRKEEVHRSIEIIPIRVLEIGTVNEAFEWASSTIKKLLKKDFTASLEDVEKIQQIIDSENFKAQLREVWESIGISFGAILVNEIEGMEWVTVVDNKKEYPALCYKNGELIVYPMQLIWEKKKVGEHCDLQMEIAKF